ncbi:MAG: phosphate ABC transporter permease subunit PstC [Planctomycetes bacterium]|nr:phosphate ABC transporter permease subunit PstC [Planctomycetota bacterium]
MEEWPAPGIAGALRKRLARRWKEQVIRGVFFLCAVFSVATTAGIIWVLVSETLAFLREIPLLDFLTGTRWAPLLEPRSFGVLPLLCGTGLVAVGAGLVAIPLGLGSALFLSEYASGRARTVLKPILEVLAGVPSVVYGYFALEFVTPVLMQIFPPPATQVFNAASASIVVGIMILPVIASLSDDALRAVPQHLRHAGYALGATKFEVSTQVVLPAALSGVFASFVLALSRAIGETMAVALAAGNTPKLTLNPLQSIETMTAYIVRVSLGDTPAGTIEYQTIFAVGMSLFVITLGMNLVAHRVLRRFREVYE